MNISVNMAQMNRWQVDADNVRFYDAIMQSGGKFYSLDLRPYVQHLTDFNIFFVSSFSFGR